jgi:hypothetical protein
MDKYGDVSVEINKSEHLATVEIHRPPNNYFDDALIHHFRRCVRDPGQESCVRGDSACCRGQAVLRGREFSKPPRDQSEPDRFRQQSIEPDYFHWPDIPSLRAGTCPHCETPSIGSPASRAQPPGAAALVAIAPLCPTAAAGSGLGTGHSWIAIAVIIETTAATSNAPV